MRPVPPRHVRRAGLLLLGLALATAAWGYGYQREEDPLLKAFKDALVHARKGDWDEVARDVEGLRWQVDELKGDVRVDFSGPLAEAVESRDPQRLAGALANLVYLALLQKFHWNDQEAIADYQKAKARLYSAEVYYVDVLDGNVNRIDRRDGTRRSERIKELLRVARKTLGSPGLFGAGSKPADPDAFRAATGEIRRLLGEAFPAFVKPE